MSGVMRGDLDGRLYGARKRARGGLLGTDEKSRELILGARMDAEKVLRVYSRNYTIQLFAVIYSELC